MDFVVVYFYNGLHIPISNSSSFFFFFPRNIYLFISLHRILVVANGI